MYPYTPSTRDDGRGATPSPHWQQHSYPPALTEWPARSPYPEWSTWPPATPPPPRRRGARWAAATVGVVVLAAVASAIVWWPSSTGDRESGTASATPSQTPAPLVAVPVTAMDGLLLTRTEAGKIFGTGPLGDREHRSDQVYTQMVPQRTVVDDDCNLGTPALSNNHEGSGWQAVRRQYLARQESADISNGPDSLVQAVVNFPDATAAQEFVESSEAAWRRCADRSINLKRVADTNAASEYWTTGEMSETAGGIRMSWTREGADGWHCHDSMTPHNNIVIELEVCGRSSSQPLDDITAEITENIEAAQ
ncbi:MAG TPA: sensor domain-containing protein [Mycobacterium sp.]|nr:sensor domain-containing protein [Mycobacterium sp.]